MEQVAVLDFGGQYNQLIARRIRDLGVYSESLPHHTDAERLKKMAPKGLFFQGGRPVSMLKGLPNVIRPSLSWGFRFWASATGCN